MKISEMTPDIQVSGNELIPASDGFLPKSLTPATLKDFTIDAIKALTLTLLVKDTDRVYILQDNELKPVNIDLVCQRAIDNAWGKSSDTTANDNDKLILKSGNTEKTLLLSNLWAYLNSKVKSVKLDDLAAPDDNTDLDASASKHGLMSKADKTKLNGVAEGANKYTLPSDVVKDSSYVHTDNNYTNSDKSKVANSPLSTNAELTKKVNVTDIIDNLLSTDPTKPLSAPQGKILKSYIDAINQLLTSDDTSLDTLQEIVNYCKAHSDELDNLSIANIGGLQDYLTGQTNSFNSNAVEKTNTFNQNVTNKITEYNNNHSTKTAELNTLKNSIEAMLPMEVTYAP